MREISHARRVLGEVTATDAVTDERPWRNGFSGDNAGGFAPFCLSVNSKDGRAMEGPSMSLFKWHDWIDDGGPIERLILWFSESTIYVEGIHMRQKVEALLQEGKLKRIQQHDSLEIESIRAHNLDVREPEKKEPIVLRFIIVPDLEARLKSDKSLAPILAAVKGAESGDKGNTGSTQ